jgi:MFS family permease
LWGHVFVSMISGVGNVASIGLMADVCRVTTLKERTPVLVGFNIAQQLGLLFGPACNLFLREINFNIGGLAVNKLNAPGLFMALLYILLVCLAAAFYYDLAREAERERRARSREEREQQQIADGSQADGDGNDDVALINPDVSWSQYKNELIRGEVIALMFLRFIGIFGQTCLEVF